MIQINKSKITYSSCDFTKVSKDVLKESNIQHIRDVKKGIDFFKTLMDTAAAKHDFDKLTDLDGFYSDFIGGFKSKVWWDNHRKINRHHLLQADGVHKNVNLVDVLEMIVDCVMTGMTRAASVYPLEIPIDVLERAFYNTVEILKNNVEVEESNSEAPQSGQTD